MRLLFFIVFGLVSILLFNYQMASNSATAAAAPVIHGESPTVAFTAPGATFTPGAIEEEAPKRKRVRVDYRSLAIGGASRVRAKQVDQRTAASGATRVQDRVARVQVDQRTAANGATRERVDTRTAENGAVRAQPDLRNRVQNGGVMGRDRAAAAVMNSGAKNPPKRKTKLLE
jgi:hypothetical protein